MQKVKTSLLIASLLLAGSAGAQKITLEYWSLWNPSEPQSKVVKEVIKDYEAANPNVKVNVNFAGRDIRKLLLPALNSGKQIDIVEGGAIYLTGGSYAKNMITLDKYLSKPSLDDPGKTVKQTIIPGLFNLTREKGRLMGIPHVAATILYFYSKDAFKKAGIKSEPNTWPEFVTALKALKGAGYVPITVDEDAYVDINFGYAVLRAAGSCSAATKVMTDKSGRLWNSPEYLNMAKDIAGLWDAGYYSKDMPGSRFPGGQQRVGLGEVAMNLNGSWLPNELRTTTGPDFEWGSFPYPTHTGGKGSANDVFVSPQMLSIVSKSKYQDQAFDFIRYMVSKKAQEGFVKEAGAGSVRPDVAWPVALKDAQQIVLKSKNPVPSACDLRVSAGEMMQNVALPAFQDLMNGKLEPAAYVKRMSTESAKYWASRQ